VTESSIIQKYRWRLAASNKTTRTIERMKRAVICLLILIGFTRSTPSLLAQSSGKAVTVPVTLDHNRIVIDIYLPLKDGTTKRVRGLVDTGTAEILISLRLEQLLDKNATCVTDSCSIAPPATITIGGMVLSLTGAGPAKMPARPADFNDVLIRGMSPEIVLTSTILKNYDLVVDYANRQFTIGPPGSIKFAGTPVPVKISSDGRITLSAKVDGRSYDFGLDTGLSASMVKSALLDQWHKDKPAWPFVTGALGAANMSDSPDDMRREMIRLPSLQMGSPLLPEVMVASTGDAVPGTLTGFIGGEAFKGARIGIDYAHSTLYVEKLSSLPVSGLDVVGLTLRPEVNGRYTVVAVVPYGGQLSVGDVKVGDVLLGVDGAPVTGATMGQVWSLLGGEPGRTRKLIIERDGKRLTVDGTVRRFLSTEKN